MSYYTKSDCASCAYHIGGKNPGIRFDAGKCGLKNPHQDIANICDMYTCANNGLDGQHEYYKRINSNQKPLMQVKVKMRGVRVERGGYVFYTSGDIRYPEKCNLTEERTGKNCGTLAELDENLSKIPEMIANGIIQWPDLEDLPEYIIRLDEASDAHV